MTLGATFHFESGDPVKVKFKKENYKEFSKQIQAGRPYKENNSEFYVNPSLIKCYYIAPWADEAQEVAAEDVKENAS